MRSGLDATTQALYDSGVYDIHYRLHVNNGSGTPVNLQGRYHKLDWKMPSPSESIGSLSLSFVRETTEAGSTTSLAPGVVASAFNKLDDGTTYSPLLQLGRLTTLDIILTNVGDARPADADVRWYRVFDGIITDVDWPDWDSRTATVKCTDLAGVLRSVKSEQPYEYAQGTSIEVVARQILDNNGFTTVPLHFPTATGKVLPNTYAPGIQVSVWDQLTDLATAMGGWLCFYRYRGQSPAEVTIFPPARNKTPAQADATVEAWDYRGLGIEETEVRNVGYLVYWDVNGGQQMVGPLINQTSIDKYGGFRRTFWIKLEEDSPIRSQADAEAMLADALSDVSDPDAVASILTRPLVFAEPGTDLYTFPAKDRFFDSDQTFAPFSVNISVKPFDTSCTLEVRGSPTAGRSTWRQMSGALTFEVVVDETKAEWTEELTQLYVYAGDGGGGTAGPLPSVTRLRVMGRIGPGTKAVKLHIVGGNVDTAVDYQVTPGDPNWIRTLMYDAWDLDGGGIVNVEEDWPRDGTVYTVTITPYPVWTGTAASGHPGKAAVFQITAPEGIQEPNSDAHPATKYYVDQAVTNATGGAVDHGTLTGLGDDDHPQYLLVAGDVMAGLLNMGGYRITGLGAATVGTDAVSRDFGDGRYAQLTGALFTGNVTITRSGAALILDSGAVADVRAEWRYDGVRKGYIAAFASTLQMGADTGVNVQLNAGGAGVATLNTAGLWNVMGSSAEMLRLTSTNASPYLSIFYNDGVAHTRRGYIQATSARFRFAAEDTITAFDWRIGGDIRALMTTGAFYPQYATMQLGLSTSRWGSLWATDGDFSGSIDVAGSAALGPVIFSALGDISGVDNLAGASANFTGTVVAASFDGAFNGNAATASKLFDTVPINGVLFDGSAASYTIPLHTTAVSTGTTYYPVFTTAAGNAQAHIRTGPPALRYNADTNTLIASTFQGALTGRADTAGDAETLGGVAPSGYATSGHGHNLDSASISGVLPVDHGGTGAALAGGEQLVYFTGAVMGLTAPVYVVNEVFGPAPGSDSVPMYDASTATYRWEALSSVQAASLGGLTDTMIGSPNAQADGDLLVWKTDAAGLGNHRWLNMSRLEAGVADRNHTHANMAVTNAGNVFTQPQRINAGATSYGLEIYSTEATLHPLYLRFHQGGLYYIRLKAQSGKLSVVEGATELELDFGARNITASGGLSTTSTSALTFSGTSLATILGGYATATDLSNHTGASNPHGITKSTVGLGNVENVALSTWAGSTNITTLGTIATGNIPAARINSGVIDAARLPQTGQGVTVQGNFGQFQPHSTYNDFNAVPARWGWNYVAGSLNAPNTTSSQWYRLVAGLGSEYSIRGTGGYSLEVAFPRYDHASAGVWMRTINNGVIGSWTGLSMVGHGHPISDVTGLQNALNAKANLSGATFTGRVDVQGNLTVPTGTALFLDGGSNTYLYEDAADRITLVTGAVTAASFRSNGIYMNQTVFPWTHNGQSLGTSAYRWNAIYASAADFAGALTVVGDAYFDEWIRLTDPANLRGIYWHAGPATGFHIYPTGAADMRLRSATTNVGLAMHTSDDIPRGYFYADNSNNVGILSSSRTWAFRTNGTSIYTYGDMYVPGNSGIYFGGSTLCRITDDGTTNSLRFKSNAAMYWEVGGVWEMTLNSTELRPYTSGSIGIGSASFPFSTAYAGAFYETSRREWKNEIEDWGLERDAFMALRPRQWVWNSGAGDLMVGERGFGYVADEVADFFANPDKTSIRNARIGAQTVLMVQDHENEIVRLKRRVTELEAQLGTL